MNRLISRVFVAAALAMFGVSVNAQTSGDLRPAMRPSLRPERAQPTPKPPAPSPANPNAGNSNRGNGSSHFDDGFHGHGHGHSHRSYRPAYPDYYPGYYYGYSFGNPGFNVPSYLNPYNTGYVNQFSYGGFGYGYGIGYGYGVPFYGRGSVTRGSFPSTTPGSHYFGNPHASQYIPQY